MAGFTLLDSVLTLFVITVMISVYATFALSRTANRQTAYRVKAAALVDEEINALKRLDYSALANQANGSFKNVLYNAGAWTLANDSTTVLHLARISGLSNSPSGRLLFPAGSYGNATLEAKWKVLSDSPSNWSVGYIFRATDALNCYRVRLAAATTDLDSGAGGVQNLVIEKVVNGTVTMLYSQANAPSSTGNWMTLRLVMDSAVSPRFRLYIDGVQQNVAALTDATYLTGPAALLGWNGVHAEVDDVQTTVNAVTTTWNFNGATELPAAWTRLGVNDLPDSTPTTFDDNAILTIAAYPDASSTNLKKATVTVRWLDQGRLRSYSSEALLGTSQIGI